MALLIAGVDETGPQLCGHVPSAQCMTVLIELSRRYHADPSGTYVRYKAKAIGSGSEGAQQELEDSWNSVSLSLSFISLSY